jgi:hypothetical protein
VGPHQSDVEILLYDLCLLAQREGNCLILCMYYEDVENGIKSLGVF